MGTLIDLTNQRFGKWTVLQKDSNKKNNQIYWICRCDCGTIRSVNGNSLRHNLSKDCGCGRKQALKQTENLVGKKFNSLLVLERVDNKWKCQCDCGNITYVTTNNLRSGHIKHCKQCGYKISAQKRTTDLVNQRFGKLLVLKQVESDKNGTKWLCKCDCGNEKIISGTSLKQGLTTSCGCLKSKGEVKIIEILQLNNIKYEYQKIFNNCIFPDSQQFARFDFYIDNKYIIEYDGEQHFSYTNNGWCNKENYLKLKQRDFFKNQWCEKNNIPLIRIPYTHLNKINLNDLLLETTKFRII